MIGENLGRRVSWQSLQGHTKTEVRQLKLENVTFADDSFTFLSKSATSSKVKLTTHSIANGEDMNAMFYLH